MKICWKKILRKKANALVVFTQFLQSAEILNYLSNRDTTFYYASDLNLLKWTRLIIFPDSSENWDNFVKFCLHHSWSILNFRFYSNKKKLMKIWSKLEGTEVLKVTSPFQITWATIWVSMFEYILCTYTRTSDILYNYKFSLKVKKFSRLMTFSQGKCNFFYFLFS